MIELRRSYLVLVILSVACAVVACSSDDDPTLPPALVPAVPDASMPPAPPEPPPSDDGPPSATTDPATCEHTGPPVIDPATFPPCPMCMGGHCVPSSLVPPESAADLADCDAMNKCVPDLFITTGGNFLLPTCESTGGLEGRCMSKCIPQVAEQPGLPQSTCAADELCAPCFDPTSGMPTGACSQSCDTGPVAPPPMVQRCCDDRGACLGRDAVPEMNRADLGSDTCMGDAMLCVPDVLSGADGGRPERCDTWLGPGGCLPDCLPSLMGDFTEWFLERGSCPAGHLCAPCTDFWTDEPTGACPP